MRSPRIKKRIKANNSTVQPATPHTFPSQYLEALQEHHRKAHAPKRLVHRHIEPVEDDALEIEPKLLSGLRRAKRDGEPWITVEEICFRIFKSRRPTWFNQIRVAMALKRLCTEGIVLWGNAECSMLIPRTYTDMEGVSFAYESSAPIGPRLVFSYYGYRKQHIQKVHRLMKLVRLHGPLAAASRRLKKAKKAKPQ